MDSRKPGGMDVYVTTQGEEPNVCAAVFVGPAESRTKFLTSDPAVTTTAALYNLLKFTEDKLGGCIDGKARANVKRTTASVNTATYGSTTTNGSTITVGTPTSGRSQTTSRS